MNKAHHKKQMVKRSGARSFLRGMTLVEVLVAVGISTVVMGAVVAFEVNVFRYQRAVSGSFTTVQNAETILKNIAREIRMASQGSDGSYGIVRASTSTLMFFADLQGDNSKKRIRYTLSNNNLYRAITSPSGNPVVYPGTNESTTTIIYNVMNGTSTPLFEYFNGAYDGSQAALTSPVSVTAIRLVKINTKLVMQLAQGTTTRLYSTQVTPRNLKDNL